MDRRDTNTKDPGKGLLAKSQPTPNRDQFLWLEHVERILTEHRIPCQVTGLSARHFGARETSPAWQAQLRRDKTASRAARRCRLFRVVAHSEMECASSSRIGSALVPSWAQAVRRAAQVARTDLVDAAGPSSRIRNSTRLVASDRNCVDLSESCTPHQTSLAADPLKRS